MRFDDYWYVLAESHELTSTRVLARQVLDKRFACFRGTCGAPAVLRDCCLHRNMPLSEGVVRGGLLSCPYHGWTYDCSGRVVAIPSIAQDAPPAHCSPPYPTIEQDGFVYVRVKYDGPAEIAPFPMLHFAEPGWKNLRLQNRFANNVSNCVENFIDVPHTAYVHQGIFRSMRGERLAATVRRSNGAVHVSYRNERNNVGTFRWFLNPGGHEIHHTDSFYAPNVTSVAYEIGRKTFIITSQAVPIDDRETLVYTDLTYRFGALNALAAPFVRWHGQRIIDQDIEILARQGENIARYGAQFLDAPADLIHRMVDSIREALARGEDPSALPTLEHEIEFHV